MNFEPTRKHRVVAPFTVNLLHLVGWRFSTVGRRPPDPVPAA